MKARVDIMIEESFNKRDQTVFPLDIQHCNCNDGVMITMRVFNW